MDTLLAVWSFSLWDVGRQERLRTGGLNKLKPVEIGVTHSYSSRPFLRDLGDARKRSRIKMYHYTKHIQQEFQKLKTNNKKTGTNTN